MAGKIPKMSEFYDQYKAQYNALTAAQLEAIKTPQGTCAESGYRKLLTEKQNAEANITKVDDFKKMYVEWEKGGFKVDDLTDENSLSEDLRIAEVAEL